MRTVIGLLMLAVAAAGSGQTQEMSDALDGLGHSVTVGPKAGMGMGGCTSQDLPYMGMYMGGTSPWWQGTFGQGHTMMCGGSMGGMNYDLWRVPAQPGDVFDIAFAGGYNTFLAIADDTPGASPYVQTYCTTPGTGSQAGMYIGGWMAFTVPPSFTHGSMVIQIGNAMGQMGYMMGAIRTSPATTAGCTPTATSLCLDSGRFQVSADWTKPTGESGHGNAMALTADTGYFWFFDESNIEMVVKVLDGCGVNGHQWVFAGGLTNVAVTLQVIDTQNGTPKTYQNPQGVAFEPIQDVVAFTCQ